MRKSEIEIAEPCRLEGQLRNPGREKGVVVAHPHPLYGGDMHNPVVTTIAETFAAAGWTSLTFNFRGVGRSQGSYDDGRGEIDDLLAARSFLVDSGIGEVALAGYSFGTWIIGLAAAAGRLDSASGPLFLVSPPAAFLEFPANLELPGLVRVITGENDEIAPPKLLCRLVPAWNPAVPVTVIPDCDHFYAGCLEDLARALKP
jgi:alpha/beta superfamily hydrolase